MIAILLHLLAACSGKKMSCVIIFVFQIIILHHEDLHLESYTLLIRGPSIPISIYQLARFSSFPLNVLHILDRLSSASLFLRLQLGQHMLSRTTPSEDTAADGAGG